MGMYLGRGFPAQQSYYHARCANLRSHKENSHGVCPQIHLHQLSIYRMGMLLMGISHWQYVWSFCSCAYRPDIYLRGISTQHY